MKSAFLLLALASAASAGQPPIAVSNSPPPPLIIPQADSSLPPSPISAPLILRVQEQSVIMTPEDGVANSSAAGERLITQAVGPSAPAAPMPPPQVLRNVTAPQPRGTLQSLISREDYPASALAQRQQGKVRVLLLVTAEGRVGACQIVRSSGSAVLDSATCRLLQRRARFTPARDSNGNPTPAQVEQTIEWKLP